MPLTDLPELPPEKGEWDEKEIGRRGFLEGAFVVLGAIGTAAVVLPGARFLAGHSLQPDEPAWVELGAVDNLAVDDVTRVNYSLTATDAWRNVTKRGTIYVYSNDGGATFAALSGTCTHLGCIVQWKQPDAHFVCPCHQGIFTREGAVISGPPPRPLRSLAVKEENGVLYAEI